MARVTSDFLAHLRRFNMDILEHEGTLNQALAVCYTCCNGHVLPHGSIIERLFCEFQRHEELKTVSKTKLRALVNTLKHFGCFDVDRGTDSKILLGAEYDSFVDFYDAFVWGLNAHQRVYEVLYVHRKRAPPKRIYSRSKTTRVPELLASLGIRCYKQHRAGTEDVGKMLLGF